MVVPPAAWRSALGTIPFPCVVKPLVLSGSRGVIRANDERELEAAAARVERLLAMPDVRALRDAAADDLLIEAFVPGHEVALEGVLDRGVLQLLAVFDKPDPLDGPFFEETIYVTPTSRAQATQLGVVAAVARAARAAQLWHGPIHAECRVDGEAITVLEIAARPIGGRCARALRFEGPGKPGESLEALLLRHACGDDVRLWRREACASGVMMVPIPRSGVLRRVEGVADASVVPYITGVSITAKVDQYLEALPEGASYLGFLFASGPDAPTVDAALRRAHACLRFSFDARIDVRPAG
jgi:biotin carboxylase